jgi:hypothetical protein
VFMVGGAVARSWTDIRFVPLITAVWTGGLLLVSLLHLDEFDFATAQTQIWFAAYIVYPVIGLWLTWRHGLLRAPRAGAEDVGPWARRYLVVQGVVLTLLGAALLLAPGVMVDVWPWAITPLLAQIYSTPFLSYGTASVLLGRGGNRRHVRLAGWAFFVLSLAVLVASVIHRDLFSVSDAPDVAWFIVLAAGAVMVGLLVAQPGRAPRGADSR